MSFDGLWGWACDWARASACGCLKCLRDRSCHRPSHAVPEHLRFFWHASSCPFSSLSQLPICACAASDEKSAWRVGYMVHPFPTFIPNLQYRRRRLQVASQYNWERDSVAPSTQHLHASNKTVVEYLATVSPELELANGSLFKACFTKLEKAATYLTTAENIRNELREKLAFGL